MNLIHLRKERKERKIAYRSHCRYRRLTMCSDEYNLTTSRLRPSLSLEAENEIKESEETGEELPPLKEIRRSGFGLCHTYTNHIYVYIDGS